MGSVSEDRNPDKSELPRTIERQGGFKIHSSTDTGTKSRGLTIIPRMLLILASASKKEAKGKHNAMRLKQNTWPKNALLGGKLLSNFLGIAAFSFYYPHDTKLNLLKRLIM